MSAKFLRHPMEQEFSKWRAGAQRRLLIFDADGTLRRCTVEGQPCPNKPGEWELLPGVKDRLAQYQWSRDLMIGVASNQGGVGLGILTEGVALKLLVDMFTEITGRWPLTGTIQMCPHAPGAGCACRKPKPLMLHKVMQAAGFSPAETTFIGDQTSDEQAATAAGCDFIAAADFFGWPGVIHGEVVL